MMIDEVENSSELIITLNNQTPALFKKRITAKMMIAARIDDVRKERNWSKNDLARVFKRQPSEITKWLKGTHNFTIDTIVEIEEVLNIKLLSFEEKIQSQILSYKTESVAQLICLEQWITVCKKVQKPDTIKQFYLKEE